MLRRLTPPEPRSAVGTPRRRCAWGLGCAALVVVLPALGLRALLAGLRAELPLVTGAPPPSADPVPVGPTVGTCAVELRAAPAAAYTIEPDPFSESTRLVFHPEVALPPGEVMVTLNLGLGHAPLSLTFPMGVVEPVIGLPCGWVTIDAQANGLARQGRAQWLEPGAVERVELALRPLGWVSGLVLDPDGAAVEGASVRLGPPDRYEEEWGTTWTAGDLEPPRGPVERWGSAQTDRAGRFTIEAPTGPAPWEGDDDPLKLVVIASAEGYLPVRADLALRPSAQPPALRLQLADVRGVVVRCRGFRHGSCPPLACGGALTPAFGAGGCGPADPSVTGDRGASGLRAEVCACPDVGAVVRGGGLELSVPDDVDEVLLDAGGGSVRGVVAGWGPEVEGTVNALRREPDLYTMLRTPGVRTYGSIADDGAFEIIGLPPGDWLVAVVVDGLAPLRSDGSLSDQGSAFSAQVRVDGLRQGERRDLGTLDPAQFGALELRCPDPLTGQVPELGFPLATWRPSGDPSVSARGILWCDEITGGIPPGIWTIERLPALWDSATVEVHAGRTTLVTLGGGDVQDPLAEAGAALSVDREGLVVDAVLPDSLAAGLGLRAGDRVRGVQVAGAALPLDQLLGEGGELEAISGLVGLAQELGAEGGLDALGISLEVEREEGGEVVALPVRLGEVEAE